MKRIAWLLLYGLIIVPLGAAPKSSNSISARDPVLRSTEPVAPTAVKITDRLGCSSLVQCKQSTDKAFKVIADLGFQWVDLSCLNWAPHVKVPDLVKNFDAEATRVETALANHGLRVANLTFDNVEVLPFDQYQPQFEAVVKLAVRLKARLINLMAASPKVDRNDYVTKLKKLQAIAEKSGVLLTLETHCNQITERPADAAWLCRQVPGLGLTLDPSHYFAGPNQGASFTNLMPLVQGTGFRAGGMSWAEIQLPWGEGPINFTDIVRQLEAVGYKGFYVTEYIEGFGKPDAIEEARRFLEWAKKL